MQSASVIDLSTSAELALTRMLEAGRVVGRDSDGRRLIVVAVDDWILDWFGKSRCHQPRPKQRP